MKPIDIGETSDGYHTFNELYEHRHALFLALMAIYNASTINAWMSKKHSDGTSMDGWFIAGIELPTGQISYHLPDRLWSKCLRTQASVLPKAPVWDGHTSQDVITRLLTFVELI